METNEHARLSIPWTNEEVDFAFKCLSEGMTASQTAVKIMERGMRANCALTTRNMVVGLWNRHKERKLQCQASQSLYLDLAKVEKRKKAREKLRNYVPKKPIAPFIKKEKEPISDEGVSFEFLEKDMCRFPYGDPLKPSLRYCGQPVDHAKGRSYCTMHYMICYVPSRKS